MVIRELKPENYLNSGGSAVQGDLNKKWQEDSIMI
jgi:hypothetical protein